MAKAKAKSNKKLKTFLYAFITVLTIIALCMAWTIYVLSDFTGSGPKTVDSTLFNTSQAYSFNRRRGAD